MINKIARGRKLNLQKMQKLETFVTFEDWLKAKDNNEIGAKDFNFDQMQQIKAK